MDNRHWSYEPYDPYARRQPGDDDGWVVAGDEPNGHAPPSRNGSPGPPRQRYGDRPPPSYPMGNDYPTQARSYPGYPPPAYPPQPGQPGQPGPRHQYPPQRAPYPPPGQPPQGQSPPAYPAGPARGRPQPEPPPDDELDEEPRPTLAPAITWAITAFVVPMMLYLAWAFTRSGTAPAGCVDASGAPCQAPRVEAAEDLLSVLPALTGAFLLSLLIAVGLRRIATGWRAASVGFAAAVVGAGIATVVAAALR